MVKKSTSKKIAFVIPLILRYSSPKDIQELATACGVLSCTEQDQLNSLDLADKALLLSLCIDTPLTSYTTPSLTESLVP